jgi:hypothetical protein
MKDGLDYDVIGIFYDVDRNLFIDEDGFVIYSIFELITPADLMLFRYYERDTIFTHRSMKGVLIEMYWPDEPEIDEWGHPYVPVIELIDPCKQHK